MMECPVREPCPPKCCYPDMRRSNLTCEAPGTTALLWKHQSGRGPAEDGGLNASERPWLRLVIRNRQGDRAKNYLATRLARKLSSQPAALRLLRNELFPGALRRRFCATCLMAAKLAGAWSVRRGT